MFKHVLSFVTARCDCFRDLGFAARVLTFLSGAVMLFFFSLVAGTVEGHYWPVVGSARFTAMTPLDDGFTMVRGDAEKLREGCRFDHLEWFLGLPGDDVRADVTILTSPVNRPIGAFTFGPWRVQLTPDQITKRSHIVMFHRCHDVTVYGKTVLRLWLTETDFWASPEGDGR